MNRRLLIIIIAILLGLAVILGGWRFIVYRSTPLPVTEKSATSTPLFPTGQKITPAAPISQTTGRSSASDNTGPNNQIAPSSALIQISTRPVAGMFAAGTSSASSVLFVERATGHVYGLAPGSSQSERLSQTTIPKLVWATGAATPSGIKIALQYLTDGRRQNFLAGLNLASSTPGENFARTDNQATLGELRGALLGGTVDQMVFSPAQDKLFYLEQASNGVIGRIIDPAKLNQPTNVFASPLGEWLASWPASSTIALLTKPTAAAEGYLYLLNVKTKQSRRVLSGARGLLALVAPDGQKALASASTGNRLSFGWYDFKNNQWRPLSVSTLADKCVWASDAVTVYCGVPTTLPPAIYPDDWYRGEISLADNLWRINILTGQGQIILNPQLDNRQPLDVWQPLLANDGRMFYFINKRDSTLWAFELRPEF